ncbi:MULTISPECIES: O-antigen polymerase [unclassified Acinetobacter]|uniref:O-antigen polymerase n=1 Tax=unclassified Acinetobacter TaxID=196816 RepID=UPI001F22428C|nr:MULTISPECIES: O-antigen polymerase [unclassified Acinetobacter]
MKVKIYNIILLLNFLFCMISLGIYYNAPVSYSYNYNLFVFVIFLFINFYFFYFNRSFEAGVGFEFLFFIGFMMGNFIYPIFYYPTNPYISVFQFPTNYSVINKSTALALVAYTFYMLFVSDFNKSIVNIKYRYTVSSKLVYTVTIISFFLLVIFFYTGGISRLINVYKGIVNLNDVTNSSYVGLLFEVVTMLLACLVFLTKSIKLRFFVIFYLILVALILLSTGSRGFSISIFLILMVGYSLLVKKIKGILLLVMLFLGAVSMYFLMILRELGIDQVDNTNKALNRLRDSQNVFDPFLDLIVNNRNLYILVDFVDEYNSVYFVNAFTSLLNIVPGIGKLTDFFNIPDYLVSGNLPTYLHFGRNADFGLGTNIVGEAYLSLGLLGVIVVFSLLGSLVKFLKFKNNLILFIAYLMLAGQALFIIRSDYLFPLRKISWAIFLFFILTKIFPVKSHIK